MVKQQLVWQDMATAPKDREIVVGIESEYERRLSLDIVKFEIEDDIYAVEEGDVPSWFSEDKHYYYCSTELIGWSELPTKDMVDEKL